MSEHPPELPSHLQLATAAVRVFSDDGKLDVPELDYLLSLAMRDGTIDAREREVLAALLGEVSTYELPAEVRSRIEEVRAQYGI